MSRRVLYSADDDRQRSVRGAILITLRKSDERFHARHGWLDSHHTFSFADYHDPRHMGFRALRVINEDRVAAGEGFGAHGHRDMEIISYVIEGALAHKDSLGTGSVLHPGDVQRMSAGTGVTHSEFNGSKAEEVHFLQIWILPGERAIKPSYEEKRFSLDENKGALRVIASPDGRDGSLSVHQDVTLLGAVLDGGQELRYAIAPGRHAWVQVVRGSLQLGPHTLVAGDGAAISDEETVSLRGETASEVLLFDLA